MALRVPFRRLSPEFERAQRENKAGGWRRLGSLVDRNFAEIEAAADAPLVPPSWTSVTFQNSWTDYGAPFQTARYCKFNGVVYVEGLIKSGTIGLAAFTLPVGYRPAATVRFSQISGGAATGAADVTAAGEVIPVLGVNDYYGVTLSFVASGG